MQLKANITGCAYAAEQLLRKIVYLLCCEAVFVAFDTLKNRFIAAQKVIPRLAKERIAIVE